MRLHTTDLLTEGLNDALSAAGLPAVGAMFWEVPRDERHGDYATNVAMTLARAARQPPRKIAEAIVAHFPPSAAVERLEIAGPGFVNVFLSPAWCGRALSPRVRLGQPHRSAGHRQCARGRRGRCARADPPVPGPHGRDAVLRQRRRQPVPCPRALFRRAPASGPGRSDRAAGGVLPWRVPPRP